MEDISFTKPSLHLVPIYQTPRKWKDEQPGWLNWLPCPQPEPRPIRFMSHNANHYSMKAYDVFTMFQGLLKMVKRECSLCQSRIFVHQSLIIPTIISKA